MPFGPNFPQLHISEPSSGFTPGPRSASSIFDVNRRVHRFGPKLQIKSLCTNHASSALHDGPIGSFYNSILLWCVRCICLSLDSTFMQEVINFGHKFSSVVGLQGFDLHAGLILHQGFVCLEFKHLSFRFQKLNMSFSRKVVDEGDKVACPTTRCGFHWSAHITMHKFQKLGSLCHFIFRKRCPLLFAFNASFTHMVQWHFFQIHAIDHFLHFVRLAMLRWPHLWCQSVTPSFEDFATFALSFRTLTLRIYKFFFFRASTTTIPWALFTLQPSLSNSTFKPSEMSLLRKMRLFLNLGTWRTWVMVVNNILPLACIVALMLPLLMASKMVSSPMHTFCGTMDL